MSLFNLVVQHGFMSSSYNGERRCWPISNGTRWLIDDRRRRFLSRQAHTDCPGAMRPVWRGPAIRHACTTKTPTWKEVIWKENWLRRPSRTAIESSVSPLATSLDTHQARPCAPCARIKACCLKNVLALSSIRRWFVDCQRHRMYDELIIIIIFTANGISQFFY